MRWSQMNSAQRAWLQARAKFNRHGKPMNAAAQVLVASKQIDRDIDRAREKAAREAMAQAVAEYQGEVKKLPTGAAYGARGTFKRRSGAMPMGFYRQAGVAV